MTGKIEDLSVAKKNKVLNKMLGCCLTGRKTEDGTLPKPDGAAKMKSGSASPQPDDINGSALREEGR